MNRLVFMGTPLFAELILQALLGHFDIAAVITQPDRGAGRGRKIKASCTKTFAQEHGLPMLQPERIGDSGVIELLRAFRPRLIVVAAYGQILPPDVLSVPDCGAINVHASLLPRHRGAAPIPASILAGDQQTGVTIMLMDEGLDTGPILSQAAQQILDHDTTASLTLKLGRLGGRLLLDTLPRWLSGSLEATAQDGRAATYARPVHREDGRIDWTDSADKIDRLIRAYNPWPGAFTSWGGKELKLIRAHPERSEPQSQSVGTVVLRGSHPAIVTGDGLLVLEELQLAGKHRLGAVEFARGQRAFVGATLL